MLGILCLWKEIYFFSQGVYLSRGCQHGKPQLNYIVSHMSNTNNQILKSYQDLFANKKSPFFPKSFKMFGFYHLYMMCQKK